MNAPLGKRIEPKIMGFFWTIDEEIKFLDIFRPQGGSAWNFWASGTRTEHIFHGRLNEQNRSSAILEQ